jgi:hypothetical protein
MWQVRVWLVNFCSVAYEISGCPGQPKFRSMWERYCHGVDAIVYDDGTLVFYNL